MPPKKLQEIGPGGILTPCPRQGNRRGTGTLPRPAWLLDREASARSSTVTTPLGAGFFPGRGGQVLLPGQPDFQGPILAAWLYDFTC